MFGKKQNTQQPKQSKIIAALDIGTGKIVCLIARYDPQAGFTILGVGHQASKGVRSGMVVDTALAERAIGQAVQAAEQAARSHLRGVPIEKIIIGVPSKNALSYPSQFELNLKGGEIQASHIVKMMNGCRNESVPDSMEIIHKIPLGYHVDDNDNIKNPVGMMAEKVKAQALEIAVPSLPLRNIAKSVENNHLEIEFFCLNPYASGLACLVDDEVKIGATVIDIGAGTSTISIFAEGHLLYTGSVPIGGNHITSDIAKGLTTPVAHAERMKTLYGSAIASPIHDRDMIDVHLVGEDEIANVQQIPRSLLLGIIQPRLEEIFEMIRAQIDDSGFRELSGRRVVLTGGTSQLPGIAELAGYILDKQVRLGAPDISEKLKAPIFSTAVGLLQYGVNHVDETPAVTSPYSTWSIFEQLKQWVKDNW